MKFNYLLGALCLSTFVFSSCGGDDHVPTPNEPTVIKKSLEVVTQNEGTKDNMFPDYDKWVYVNLETGDTAIRKDVSAKEWRTYSDDGEKTDRFGKYKITKTVEAGKDNAPAKWHLAFHIYDIKTNGGEAYMSDTTDIETKRHKSLFDLRHEWYDDQTDRNGLHVELREHGPLLLDAQGERSDGSI